MKREKLMLRTLVDYITELGLYPDWPYRNTAIDSYICQPCAIKESNIDKVFWGVTLTEPINYHCYQCRVYKIEYFVIRDVKRELSLISDLTREEQLKHIGNILSHVQVSSIQLNAENIAPINELKSIAYAIDKEFPWEFI